MYVILKNIHLTCVVTTICLFTLRAYWAFGKSPQLATRWARIVPHCIDAILLASAIALLFLVKQSPFVHGWLTAKFFALIAYVVFGSLTLRPGQSAARRGVYLTGTLVSFGYIVAVALTHRPLPFLP